MGRLSRRYRCSNDGWKQKLNHDASAHVYGVNIVKHCLLQGRLLNRDGDGRADVDRKPVFLGLHCQTALCMKGDD